LAAASLASRLRAGDALISGWSTVTDPVIAETVARQAFDCVIMDMQHGLHDVRSIGQCLTALALAGKPGIVRIPFGDNASASRALDLGAAAIIAPMINSADEARAFIAAAKYPPVGERSWGPNRAMALSGRGAQEHLEASNAETLAIVMIETDRALAALPGILAVPGVDGVFIGPSDLSVTLSAGKRIAPADDNLDGVIGRIVAAATAAGKFAGIYAATPERARHHLALGCRLIALGADTAYLAGGAAAMLAPLR
jgi:4-hydroxy-2-oxoheptanedioate aldolase